jgi:hypothetical protein
MAFPWLPLAFGASAIGGIASYFANKSALERAELLQNQALQQFLSITIPDPKDQRIALEEFVLQGTINPQLEAAISQAPSEFEKIVTSWEDKQAQRRALSELEQIGYKGGMRLQDKATIQEALKDSQSRERGERLAISAEMARRGLSGSGFEVAGRLAAQQGSADRDAMTSLKAASDAQNRALSAIQSAGELGTKYRTQEFGEQAQKAAAADVINRFNTENLRDVQMRNLASQNRAQELNLSRKQDLANMNTQMRNYQQEYNKGLLQKQYENQLQRAAGASQQFQPLAATQMRSGEQLGNLFSNVASGAAGAATSMANMDFWDKYFKDKNKTTGDKIG